MLRYFVKFKLFHNEQFPFIKGRSTSDVVVELLKKIYEAWEELYDALAMFCDLSKAFDCDQSVY